MATDRVMARDQLTADPEADLRGTPEEDATLLADLERRFQERQARTS